MIIDKKRAAAEARALQTALVLAAHMDWTFGRGPLLANSFAQFLYVEKPLLLLVPTSAGLPYSMRQVDPVIRETRSDALIVSRADGLSPQFAFATWSRRGIAWSQPLALWLGGNGDTWLVPAADGGDGLGFRLVNEVHNAAAVPCTTKVEQQVGYHRALAWMAKVCP